jgi:hypothetical protein
MEGRMERMGRIERMKRRGGRKRRRKLPEELGKNEVEARSRRVV